MGKKIESQSKKSGKKLGHRSKTKGEKVRGRLKKRLRRKEYVGMKKEWPPLKECPQYKFGMITLYMARRDCEEKYDSDEIKYYYDKGLFGEQILRSYKPSDIKKFLHQVRSSRGYDVDVCPPSFMDSTFLPIVDLKTTLQAHNFPQKMAIITKKLVKHIKSKTGKVYKYVETLNLVFSRNRIFLLTFTAKEVADDAELEMFLAAVFAPGLEFHKYAVLECFLKPDGPPPLEC